MCNSCASLLFSFWAEVICAHDLVSACQCTSSLSGSYCVIIDTSGLKVSCTGSVGLELAAGKDGKAVGSEVGQYTVWHSSNIPCYYGPCVVIDRSFC